MHAEMITKISNVKGKVMTTQEMIAGMLKENCGTHFLDSGGAYGRHWQRNQAREFAKEESTTLKFSIWNDVPQIEMEHNVYHWLESRCEFDTKLDAIFHGAFKQEVDGDNGKYWLEVMEAFPEWVAENVARHTYTLRGKVVEERKALAKYKVAMKRLEDEEFVRTTRPIVVNTYNGEDMLSQVLQYVYFTWGGEEYVVLQIHGGADVRGGYSTPHVFRCDANGNEMSIFDNAKGSIGCTGKNHHPTALALKERQENNTQLTIPGFPPDPMIDFDGCNKYWTTDDSCSWYSEGWCGRDYVNLEDMPSVDLEAEAEAAKDTEEPNATAKFKPGEWRPGVLCIQDGKGYCPYCGALLAGGEQDSTGRLE